MRKPGIDGVPGLPVMANASWGSSGAVATAAAPAPRVLKKPRRPAAGALSWVDEVMRVSPSGAWVRGAGRASAHGDGRDLDRDVAWQPGHLHGGACGRHGLEV